LTCARLRSAVVAIVADEGIESFSAERVALRSGLGFEVLDAHYASAADCLYDAYEEVSRSIHQDFAAAFAAEPSWYEGLALAGRTLLARLASDPDEARFCFVEVLRGDHELARLRADSRRRLVDLFVSELRRRCDNEVPRMQLELLIGAAFQAIASAINGGNITELPGIMPELTSRAYVFQPAAA
jgi:hypothetical protein